MVVASDVSERAEQQDGHRPIKSIDVRSTGWAEQHREHRYGSWKPRLLWALTSRSWVKLPINFFLIHHRDGPVLFDTGVDPALVSDPNYIPQAIGRFLLNRIFRFHVSADDRLDTILARDGVEARDIRLAVISHLHFDHVGGIAQIPQARLLVSEREWAQLSKPHPEREWILREHIELLGAHWHPFAFQPTDEPIFEGFDGIYDVAGDGSMVLLPTPGHTPGSLSMLIRQDGWAPIMLVGDLTYEAGLLDRGAIPGTGNADLLRASYDKVQTLKNRLPDLVIVPSHDFAAADLIANATTPPYVSSSRSDG